MTSEEPEPKSPGLRRDTPCPAKPGWPHCDCWFRGKNCCDCGACDCGAPKEEKK